jgi:hypothetical protein
MNRFYTFAFASLLRSPYGARSANDVSSLFTDSLRIEIVQGERITAVRRCDMRLEVVRRLHVLRRSFRSATPKCAARVDRPPTALQAPQDKLGMTSG